MHTSAFWNCKSSNTFELRKKNVYIKKHVFFQCSVTAFFHSPFPFLRSSIEIFIATVVHEIFFALAHTYYTVYYIEFVGYISKWRLLFNAIPCTVCTWFLLWIRERAHFASPKRCFGFATHSANFFFCFFYNSWSSACTFQWNSHTTVECKRFVCICAKEHFQ